MNKHLGNLGMDFYETIDTLLEIYDWDNELSNITLNALKEIIEDIQYKFDYKSNKSIAYIITKKLPIFSRNENNLYSISKEFKEYRPRSHSESFRKECFLRFCYNNSEPFKRYCAYLFSNSRIDVKTQKAIVSKGMLRLIEQDFKSYNYFHRKLLLDLGLISIEKLSAVCNLRLYQAIIETWEVALKIIDANAIKIFDSFHKEHRSRELDCSRAYKLLGDFGMSKPKEIIQLLRDKGIILVRSIRSGNYIEF